MGLLPPDPFPTVAPTRGARILGALAPQRWPRGTKDKLYGLVTSGASIGFMLVFLFGMLGAMVFSAMVGPRDVARAERAHMPAPHFWPVGR